MHSWIASSPGACHRAGHFGPDPVGLLAMTDGELRAMTRALPTAGIVAAFAILAASIIGPARAQSVADFYAHTPITLLVGSGVGGGFDAYARVMAMHYGHHIPGNPSVVVKNMPGATGLVAINALYNTAPRDGSTILASFNSVVMSALYGDANARFDPRKFGWIGSLGKQTGTCLTWHDAPAKTIEDARRQEVLVGATGNGSTPVMFPKLLNAMIGTKFKIVAGYSTAGLRLAVERGEVEGICGVAWETHMASVPSWIIDHKVNFLLQLGLSESAHLPGVPLAIDMIKNPQDRQVFELLAIPQEFGRPYLAPPGVPPERLAALQKGFDELLHDDAYRADAERAKQFIDPLSAKEVEALIDRAYAAPKDIVARAAVYGATNDN
jgi:tripartite-type tricarboxylate transporter receptor subunit TctC